ncbi:MAG: chemotaxis protein CheW [Methanospirillum sp.]|uniref:chemotaxis protein CheW n=1 Tax=Methanospirillum sp. TaxID=45200 RepID=UPI00236C73CC|nr:chemotaxis protein CheW [Methanospirillum sp.]MDD1728936.1 chemotaxis protein CheW [Methanospirillum sp.]
MFGSSQSGRPGHETNTEESFQIVEFLLGQDHYAINLFDVKEIVEYARITRLPNSPPYIKGIIDLRGEITTIIDLKQQLAITAESATSEENSRIIVLDDRLTSSKTGIMVDDVLTVSTCYSDQVDVTATSGDDGSHIMGIIKKQTRDKEKEVTQLIIWLDIKSLFTAMEQN